MKQNYLLLHYAYGNPFTRIRYKTSHYLKQLFDNNSIERPLRNLITTTNV